MSALRPTAQELADELETLRRACAYRGGKGPRTDEPRERVLWEEIARLRLVVRELASRARNDDDVRGIAAAALARIGVAQKEK